MGADYYESDEQREGFFKAGKLPIGIGEGTTISNTIVDKNARIGRKCQIVNKVLLLPSGCAQLRCLPA